MVAMATPSEGFPRQTEGTGGGSGLPKEVVSKQRPDWGFGGSESGERGQAERMLARSRHPGLEVPEKLGTLSGRGQNLRLSQTQTTSGLLEGAGAPGSLWRVSAGQSLDHISIFEQPLWRKDGRIKNKSPGSSLMVQ